MGLKNLLRKQKLRTDFYWIKTLIKECEPTKLGGQYFWYDWSRGGPKNSLVSLFIYRYKLKMVEIRDKLRSAKKILNELKTSLDPDEFKKLIERFNEYVNFYAKYRDPIKFIEFKSQSLNSRQMSHVQSATAQTQYDQTMAKFRKT